MAARSLKHKALFVSPSTAKTLSSYLIKRGIDPQQIETTIGNAISDLDSTDFRLPIERYHALWDLALDYTNNPALGLELGSHPINEEMGLVGHIFFNNATLELALKQLERYYSLINEGMHIELTTDDQFAYIHYLCNVKRAYCIADMDRTLAISIHRAKQYISPTLSIEFVCFQHSAPTYIDHYSEVFPCPVQFGKEHCCIAFKKRYLDFELPKRSSYLHKILTGHIESLLSRIKPKPSLSDKVRKLIEQKLAKDCVDAEHIAEKLFMSRHTLYRKLKQEGMAFHELVDQVRKEKALFYLSSGKRSLSEIAFLLGFSELSAFSRAFKRWTGQSPAHYKNVGHE